MGDQRLMSADTIRQELGLSRRELERMVDAGEIRKMVVGQRCVRYLAVERKPEPPVADLSPFGSHFSRATMDRSLRTYFIWNDVYVKVGRSTFPEGRFRDIYNSPLSAGAPEDIARGGKLKLFAYLGTDKEAEMHRALLAHHVCFEWFFRVPESEMVIFDYLARYPW